MIWIILAALGIPIWFVLGGLAATLVSRRSFKQRRGVFPVKLRVVSGEVSTLKDSWPRRPDVRETMMGPFAETSTTYDATPPG
jgi:hypothetical protein